MRVLASDAAGLTPENDEGCHEIATSTSPKAPARAMNAFGGAAFLGRAAVVADSSWDAVGFQVVLDRGSGEHGGGAQQVVAAAMAEARAGEWLLLCYAGLLRQAGQGVVFAEDRDHRAGFSGLAHYRGGDARDVTGDAKTLGLQHRDMLRARTELRVAEFRAIPDAVGESDEIALVGIDQTPDLLGVLHHRISRAATWRKQVVR